MQPNRIFLLLVFSSIDIFVHRKSIIDSSNTMIKNSNEKCRKSDVKLITRRHSLMVHFVNEFVQKDVNYHASQ